MAFIVVIPVISHDAFLIVCFYIYGHAKLMDWMAVLPILVENHFEQVAQMPVYIYFVNC